VDPPLGSVKSAWDKMLSSRIYSNDIITHSDGSQIDSVGLSLCGWVKNGANKKKAWLMIPGRGYLDSINQE